MIQIGQIEQSLDYPEVQRDSFVKLHAMQKAPRFVQTSNRAL